VPGASRLPAIQLGRRKLVRPAALHAWLIQMEAADAMIPSGIDAVGASRRGH